MRKDWKITYDSDNVKVRLGNEEVILFLTTKDKETIENKRTNADKVKATNKALLRLASDAKRFINSRS